MMTSAESMPGRAALSGAEVKASCSAIAENGKSVELLGSYSEGVQTSRCEHSFGLVESVHESDIADADDPQGQDENSESVESEVSFEICAMTTRGQKRAQLGNPAGRRGSHTAEFQAQLPTRRERVTVKWRGGGNFAAELTGKSIGDKVEVQFLGVGGALTPDVEFVPKAWLVGPKPVASPRGRGRPKLLKLKEKPASVTGAKRCCPKVDVATRGVAVPSARSPAPVLSAVTSKRRPVKAKCQPAVGDSAVSQVLPRLRAPTKPVQLEWRGPQDGPDPLGDIDIQLFNPSSNRTDIKCFDCERWVPVHVDVAGCYPDPLRFFCRYVTGDLGCKWAL
eukprot:TRINITY_DN90864_c0_g1_i1.p1 TRINITY_DN90864_c0_g1~~TRINITY_DN90864_c0_g1_i1.p1  ORF type:complete len:336 (-),score=29.34 TRINITY_DN90864_c0_g1_i1:87-1094(-)